MEKSLFDGGVVVGATPKLLPASKTCILDARDDWLPIYFTSSRVQPYSTWLYFILAVAASTFEVFHLFASDIALIFYLIKSRHIAYFNHLL